MKMYSIAIAALMMSVTVTAQKNEIKAIEKSMKSGNMIEARNLIQSSAAVFENASPAEQAQYQLFIGQIHFELAKKGADVANNLKLAGEAFQKLIAIEEASGRKKFTEGAKASIVEVKGTLINEAIKNGNENKFKEAYKKLYLAYQLDKSDQINLYYAASYAVNAQDYDAAIEYYEELKRLNFSGERMNYKAKSVINDQVEFFATKQDRDNAVKLKTHTEPKDEKEPSKKGEIYGNYALILIQKGEIDKAKEALADARRLNPNDVTLILSEANMYYNLGELDKYTELVNQAIKQRPNDAELFYNLGVVNTKQKKFEEAIAFYKRAIELDPKYADAYLNLGVVMLEEDNAIIEKMNLLGSSAADNKKYDELKKQRAEVLRRAMPYVEKAVELGAEIDVMRTLLNIYYTLDMDDKYNALKKRIDQMK